MAAPVFDNPLVKLNLTHSQLTIRVPEVRFSLREPICEIKLSLVSRFGTSVDFMELELQDQEGKHVSYMNDELKPLGFYSPEEGYHIHVILQFTPR